MFDFGEMFDQIDQRALEEQWPNIVLKLHTQFTLNVPDNIVPITDVDLLNFVSLLKLFSAERAQISASTNALFVFSKVSSFYFVLVLILILL